VSKLSKSIRSLKFVVNNRDSSSSKDIHLKNVSLEPLELKEEPASQQGSGASDQARRASTDSITLERPE
jgi:hypothetical protein